MSVAVTPSAVAPPTLVSGIVSIPPSPGSTKLSPSPPTAVVATVPTSRNGAGSASITCSAANASTMPAPESRSTPAASMSRAVLVSARRILFRRQSRPGGFDQRGDGGGVRRGGRSAEECPEPGHAGRDAVGRGQVGFLADLAAVAAEQQVTRRDRRAVGFIKYTTVAVGAEKLDGIGRPPMNDPLPASATLIAATAKASGGGGVAANRAGSRDPQLATKIVQV